MERHSVDFPDQLGTLSDFIFVEVTIKTWEENEIKAQNLFTDGKFISLSVNLINWYDQTRKSPRLQTMNLKSGFSNATFPSYRWRTSVSIDGPQKKYWAGLKASNLSFLRRKVNRQVLKTFSPTWRRRKVATSPQKMTWVWNLHPSRSLRTISRIRLTQILWQLGE